MLCSLAPVAVVASVALAQPSSQDPVQVALALRAAKLAVYKDTGQDEHVRIEALRDAVAVLEKLIAEFPDHPDRLDWQLQLGIDLVSRLAQPYYDNLLLFGTDPDNRAGLLPIAVKAETVFEQLEKALWRVEHRLERLSPAEYEARNREGLVRRIARIRWQADYYHAWARFLHALALAPADPRRTSLLERTLVYLRPRTKRAARSPADAEQRVPLLVLAGMASRRIARPSQAIDYLTRAIEAAASDGGQPADPQGFWFALVARLEHIRALTDAARWDESHAAARRCGDWLNKTAATEFRPRLAMALAEARSYQRQAAATTDARSARRCLANARKALLQLAGQFPQHRQAVWIRLYPLLRAEDPATLSGPARIAYIAGVLHEIAPAQTQPAGPSTAPAPRPLSPDATRRLRQAVALAESLLKDPAPETTPLRPDALFYLAACRQRMGHDEQAVDHLLELVQTYPQYDRRRLAARYAVAIAERLYRDPVRGTTREVQNRLKQTLGVLVTVFPDSSLAYDARLLLGQVLDRLGEHARAAAEYARIPPSHERYLDAHFFRLQCSFHELLARAAGSDDSAASTDAALALVRSARRYAAEALAAARRITSAERVRRLRTYAANSLLMAAELLSGPILARSADALDVLTDFETRFADQPELIGRALRIRIVAHQQLGQLTDAAALIRPYLARHPRDAGGVLQGLLDAMNAAAARPGTARPDKARALAEQRLELAEQLYAWAQEHPDRLGQSGLLPFRLQLAQAYLDAGQAEAALQLFTACCREDATRHPDARPHSAAALFGKAQALFELGRHAAAQELFYDLWMQSAPYSPLWWRALLGSLECHTRMGTDPRMILQSIAQQRATHPDLGGPDLWARFEQIEQLCRQRIRRAQTAPSPDATAR